MFRAAELARSHSIFTLILEQRNRKCDSADPAAAVDYYVTAKFHLVDLAGSERAKRLDPQWAQDVSSGKYKKSFKVCYT